MQTRTTAKFVFDEEETENNEPASQKKWRIGKLANMPIPASINLSEFDIDNPPHGIVKKITTLMSTNCNRALRGGAYTLMAAQVVSSALGGSRGLDGCKLSLVTITLALSAAGKDHPQKIAKQLISFAGMTVNGDIRTDKDIIRALLEDGRCTYIIDEAHKITPNNEVENRSVSNITAVLMEIATTSCFSLSTLHREEFLSKFETMLSRSKKSIDNSEKEIKKLKDQDEHDSDTIFVLNETVNQNKRIIKKLKKRLTSVLDGVSEPSLNLAMFSTHQKLADIINIDSVESGFLGRALICDCGSLRQPLKFFGSEQERDLAKKKEKRLLSEACHDIASLTQFSNSIDLKDAATLFKITDKARSMLNEIVATYDKDEYRNDYRLGALFSRVYERVIAFSSILSVNSQLDSEQECLFLITEEHVKFALGVVLTSLSNLSANLIINIAAESPIPEEQLFGVKSMILETLRDFTENSDENVWFEVQKIKKKTSDRRFYRKIMKEENNKAGRGNKIDLFDRSLVELELSGIIVTDKNRKKIKLASA